MTDKQLPHNTKSEEVVIGSILTHIDAINDVAEILSPEMFYDEFLATMYENLIDLRNKGKAVDMISLLNIYKAPEDIVRMAEISEMYSPDYYLHALNVRDLYTKRRLWALTISISQEVHTPRESADIIAELQKGIEEVMLQANESSIVPISEAVRNVINQINANQKGDYLTGTDTGFSAINKACGGLQKSDLIIIAGETSQGKTSLALSIINVATQSGHPVAIYSMEMKKEQLTARLMSMNSGVSSSAILYSKLPDDAISDIVCIQADIENRPIFFDDNSTSNIDRILNSIRSMKIKHDISGAVIDYLQILNVNSKSHGSKEQAMGDVARRLKNLAKELDIWIIALSQLNRDSQNPVPNLNRLRDSGQIAEASDMVMFVYRPEYYNKYYPQPFANEPTEGTAMIDIAKGRNIGTFKFICDFDKQRTLFKERDMSLTNTSSTPSSDDDDLPF